MRARRRVDRQRQVDVDLAEEEPRAAVLVDQAGVLADPAQARVARERAFEHRRRIDEHAMPERPDLAGDAVGQLLQAMRASACGSRGPARSARRRRVRRRTASPGVVGVAGRSPARPTSRAPCRARSSPGRARLSPWRAIQSIDPYRPCVSQSRRWASSSPSSTPAMPTRWKPSSKRQRTDLRRQDVGPGAGCDGVGEWRATRQV